MALVPFPRPSPGHADDEDTSIELTDPESLDDSGRMSFLEHLDELRRRLIQSVIAAVVGCAVAFIFIQQIFAFVIGPLKAMLSNGGTFIATEPAEIFMLYLKVGAVTGLCIAMPFILWQLWLFIAPGLYANEKKFAIPFVLFSSIFFFAGAAFSHYIAFPYTWAFFLSFESDLVKFMPKLGPDLRALREDAARFRRDLPDAGTGSCLVQYGHHQCPLSDPEHEIRSPDHLHPRRRSQPRRGHPFTVDDGWSDARSLRHQHHHRVGLRPFSRS